MPAAPVSAEDNRSHRFCGAVACAPAWPAPARGSISIERLPQSVGFAQPASLPISHFHMCWLEGRDAWARPVWSARGPCGGYVTRVAKITDALAVHGSSCRKAASTAPARVGSRHGPSGRRARGAKGRQPVAPAAQRIGRSSFQSKVPCVEKCQQLLPLSAASIWVRRSPAA
jgi:hypothetical protein